MFSGRTPARTEENRLARALASRTKPFLDLTSTNPTTARIDLGTADALAALADPRGAVHVPDPKGILSAREAVAGYLADHRVSADPARLVLTASSSEAYSWLLKLLAQPGDVVLVPAPSYPLLDALAGLEAVALRRYPLPLEAGFSAQADLVAEAVARAKADRKRVAAVVLVSPNNPTGTGISTREWRRLTDLASRERFAVVSDEVFVDYRYGDSGEDDVRIAAAEPGDALVFSLGGLSKAAALPQLKLGWILAGGPTPLVADALHRLDWIADAFLSVGTPVQIALPRLLALAPRAVSAVRRRVLGNEAMLRAAFPPGSPVSVLPVPGGWSAILRVPATAPEEDLVLDLLGRHDLLVHPGHFFDFPFESFLVLSLLPPKAFLLDGTRRLAAVLHRCAG